LLAAEEGRPGTIIVLTDGTAAAWRDVDAGTLGNAAALRLEVVVVGAPERPNLGVAAVAAPQRVPGRESRVTLHVTPRMEGTDAPATLVVRSRPGGEILARTDEGGARHGDAIRLAVPVGGNGYGPEAAVVEIAPADLLDLDQRRFVCWETVPRPVAWLVGGEAGERDATQRIFANLLAPAGLGDEAQRLELVTGDVAPDDRVPALIVVPARADELPEDALLERVRAGATLVLVPQGAADEQRWPGLRPLISPVEAVAEDVDGLGIAFDDGAAAGVPEVAVAELGQARVWRRVRLTTWDREAEVVARFTDDAPAVWVRQLGRGRVILLGTSPAPAVEHAGGARGGAADVAARAGRRRGGDAPGDGALPGGRGHAGGVSGTR
jgi:hypothetical protein